MHDYFSDLDKIITDSKSILAPEAKNVLRKICFDKNFLSSALVDFFGSMVGDLRECDKKISSNVMLLRSISQQALNSFYLPAMTFHSPGQASSIVNHSIYSILTPVNTSAIVDKYTTPEDWRAEVFDPTVKLSFLERIQLNPGDVLEIMPENICYHFKFAEPTIFLKIQSQDMFVPFEWSFDSGSLQAWQCIATEPKDSYAHHLCMAAGELADERFLQPLNDMLTHGRHQIRWAAAQALAEISFEHAERALYQLADDPHPHVKNAVKNTLQKMVAKEA